MSEKKSYVAVISSKNMGYTSSVRALAGVHNKFIEFDAMSDDEVKQDTHNQKLVDAIKARLDFEKNGKIELISAGKYGIDFYNDVILSDKDLSKSYENGKISFVWSSDRYYDMDLSKFKNGMTILAPQDEIAKYKEQIGNLPIKTIGVDLVAAADSVSANASADAFVESNQQVASIISDFNYQTAEFLGGRVQLADGSWKDNDAQVFAKEANDLLLSANGGNILIGTHGLRTFTNADKTNDFAPYNAFVHALKGGMQNGQNILIVTKELREGNRVSVLQTLAKSNGRVVSNEYGIEDNGSSYNFILRDSAKKSATNRVTAEQMNFPSELLSLGGDSRSIEPAIWALTVPSNIETYEKIAQKNKAGERLITARDAYMKIVIEKSKPSVLQMKEHKKGLKK